jgi:hypothetical protein
LVDGLRPAAAIEIKYSMTPSLSKGFYNVLDDLQVPKAFVITPGDKHYPLDKNIIVSGLQFFLKSILGEL